MNVWVGWHKLHDGQGDMPIFQSKHEADKWVSQYKLGFAKLITLTEQKPWVGLTDEDCKGMNAGDKVVAMWANRILKEKNT